MLKISAVYLIGKAEIPIHYTTWALVEQALLKLFEKKRFVSEIFLGSDTDTEIGPWFWFPIPKPGFGRTLFSSKSKYFDSLNQTNTKS